MQFRATVLIRPKAGLRDPEGSTIAGALGALGYDGIGAVHVGKIIEVELAAPSAAEAEAAVAEMCERILANPVIEDYAVTVAEAATERTGA